MEEPIEEWKQKKAKLYIIEKLITYIGLEYQRLGGQIFSDYLFTHKDVAIHDMLTLLNRLTTNTVAQDAHKNVLLLLAYADMLHELQDVRKELLQIINNLQPVTHTQAPVPNVNS